MQGHCWRSRDELIRDVLLWTPIHGRAKAGRPSRTYIQQQCEDTECCPEDLPRAMNDREEWRERVRDIRATSVTWWWWWLEIIKLCAKKWSYFKTLPTNYSLTINIYIYIYIKDLAFNNLRGLICYETQPTNLSLNHNLSLSIYIYI